MALSVVQSLRNPESERIYDEAWEDLFETDEEVEACKQSRIIIKRKVSAGDQEQINDQTYQAVLKARRDNPLIQDLETKVMLGIGILVTAAVMIVSFEGPLFEDTDTGATLEMGGTLEDRLNVVRRLPLPFVQFVDQKVGEFNQAPLGKKGTEKGSRKGSGRASTRASKENQPE